MTDCDADKDRGLCSYGADDKSRVIVIAEMSKFINVPEVTIARQQGCVHTTVPKPMR